MRDRLIGYINRNRPEVAAFSVIAAGVGWIMALNLMYGLNLFLGTQPTLSGPRPEPATWPSDLATAVQTLQPADILTSIKEALPTLPVRINFDPSPLLSPVQDLLQNR